MEEVLPEELRGAPIVLLGDRQNPKAEGTFDLRGSFVFFCFFVFIWGSRG